MVINNCFLMTKTHFHNISDSSFHSMMLEQHLILLISMVMVKLISVNLFNSCSQMLPKLYLREVITNFLVY